MDLPLQRTSTIQPISTRVADHIARHGFAVVAVGFDHCDEPGCDGSDHGDAYCYTVGLSAVGCAELVVTGLSPVHATQLAAHVHHQFQAGSPLPMGRRHWLGDAPFMLRSVSDHWLANDPSRLAVWFAYTGHSPRGKQRPAVTQIVWGDANGSFPGDPRCDPFVADDQPVIADDPFGFPRRLPRAQRRARPPRCGPGHRRSA
jgi:Domain of unknown function (DUF4262)